jgi:hypothetical protein
MVYIHCKQANGLIESINPAHSQAHSCLHVSRKSVCLNSDAWNRLQAGQSAHKPSQAHFVLHVSENQSIIWMHEESSSGTGEFLWTTVFLLISMVLFVPWPMSRTVCTSLFDFCFGNLVFACPLVQEAPCCLHLSFNGTWRWGCRRMC